MACRMMKRIQFDRVRSSAAAAFSAAFSRAGGIRTSRRAVLAVDFLVMAPPGEHTGAKHRTEFAGTAGFILENAVIPIEFRNEFVETDPIVGGVEFLAGQQSLYGTTGSLLTVGKTDLAISGFQRPLVCSSPAIRRRMTFPGCGPMSICGRQVRRRRSTLCQAFGRNLGEPGRTVSPPPALSFGEVFGQSSHTYNVRHAAVHVKRNPGEIRG